MHKILEELSKSQEDEIKKHQWIESEKHGRDIGFEKAAQDWLKHHFVDWKRYHWDKAMQTIIESSRV